MLSIPVFFDVTLHYPDPHRHHAITAKIDMKMCYVTGCLIISATTAHCVVPPTPNPLAAADIFGFDLGIHDDRRSGCRFYHRSGVRLHLC
ncbi:MAG: hypothetical protein ACLU38_08150 [Dysosmobacter sp.]